MEQSQFWRIETNFFVRKWVPRIKMLKKWHLAAPVLLYNICNEDLRQTMLMDSSVAIVVAVVVHILIDSDKLAWEPLDWLTRIYRVFVPYEHRPTSLLPWLENLLWENKSSTGECISIEFFLASQASDFLITTAASACTLVEKCGGSSTGNLLRKREHTPTILAMWGISSEWTRHTSCSTCPDFWHYTT